MKKQKNILIFMGAGVLILLWMFLRENEEITDQLEGSSDWEDEW